MQFAEKYFQVARIQGYNYKGKKSTILKTTSRVKEHISHSYNLEFGLVFYIFLKNQKPNKV